MPQKPYIPYGVRQDPYDDPSEGSEILAPNQTQAAPHIPSILDLDPGIFGAGRDDLFNQYAKASAMKGLQLANKRKQQVLDDNDPELQRIQSGNDASYASGLQANQGGDLDRAQFRSGLDKIRQTLGVQDEMAATPLHQSNLNADARRAATVRGAGVTGGAHNVNGFATADPSAPLDGLTPSQQTIVKGLADYSYSLPSGTVLKQPEWQEYMARAKMLEPTFDQTQYGSRQKMRQDGTFQKNMQNLETVQGHLGGLREKGKALNNFGGLLAILNGPINSVKRKFENAAVRGYDLDQSAVGSELAAALKGGVPAEGEIKDWQGKFPDSLSPSSQDEVHETAGGLVKTRYDAGINRWDTVMGKPGDYRAHMKDRSNVAGATAAGADDSGGTVNMQGPDGSVHPVPASQVEHYKSRGATVVP